MAMRPSVICAWLGVLTFAAILGGSLVGGESYAKRIISEVLPRGRGFFRWLIRGNDPDRVDSACTTPTASKTAPEQPTEGTMLDSPYLTLALKLTLMAILCYTL